MSDSSSKPAASSTEDSPPLSRIGLNSNKAGMDGLDREKINQVILQASKGSKYYQNEVRKDQEISRRVDHMLSVLRGLSTEQKAAAMKAVDKKMAMMEKCRNLSRIIVHVDMDAFYAAIETRDNPQLKDVPMAVGGNSMLSTSNYAARRYGVRAAMPGFIAKKLCPHLMVVSPNYEKYRLASEQVKKVLSQYDPSFCPVGLDESYLDITDYVARKLDSDNPRTEETTLSELPESHWLCAEQVVQNIRKDIFRSTSLTASAGIATNKMLAKIATDMNKPNGQFLVEPTREGILKFVSELPIRKICGIGKVTEKMLNALDITLCRHLFEKRDILSLLFSQNSCDFFLGVSLGLGSAQVQRLGDRKSMSIERSFNEISDSVDLLAKCWELCKILASDMEEDGVKGKTVTVKMKTVSFEIKSRGTTLPAFVCNCEEIYRHASDLLQQEIKACAPNSLKLRLLGIKMSALNTSEYGDCNQETLKSFFKPASQDSATKNIPSTMIVGKNSVDQDRPSPGESLPTTLTCPVCSSEVSSENVILNQHLDKCLKAKTAISGAPVDANRLCIRGNKLCRRSLGGSAVIPKHKKKKLH